MIAVWASQYVGLPFRDRGRDRSGLDCWGLVRLVLAEQFGLELPSYASDYSSADARREVGKLVDGHLADWQRVPLPEAVAGDAIVLVVHGLPVHVGVYVGDGRFLHVIKGSDAVIESLNALHWRNRLEGIYRHG